MPLYFIANRGQMDERASFYVQGKDKIVYFGSGGVTFVLTSDESPGKEIPGKSPSTVKPADPRRRTRISGTPGADPAAAISDRAGDSAQRWVVKLDFIGADGDVKPVGGDETGAVVSYFKGNPKDWHAGLPTYGRLVYRSLWPGIDLAYSGTVDRLKYEFIVHPGADASRIRMAYRGASDVVLDEEGRVEVRTPLGNFRDDAPVAWQDRDGNRVEIPMRFVLEEIGGGDGARDGGNPSSGSESKAFGFELGAYDRSLPLIMDPAILIFCGYIGGSGNEIGQGIAIDAAGDVYVGGYGSSTETTFPVTVGPDLTYNGGSYDAFVAKIEASGASLVYCGYIGGSNANDKIQAIAVDGAGNVYASGYTDSTEATFPVTVGPDLTYNGGAFDAYVAKINPSGTGLVYCGYIGGSGSDYAFGVAVDGSGNAYVNGQTNSAETSFPVTVGPDLTHNGGVDGFVAKVNGSGTALHYCGYIGGSGDDRGYGIAVDGFGSAYATGLTTSSETSFPAAVGPDLTFNGYWDAYAAKINAAGTGLVYCGYIGGVDEDYGYGVAVDGSGAAFIAGRTNSAESTFPETAGPDLSHNGGFDAFVAKINAAGTALVYCGYIGGSGEDYGYGVAVDGSGYAYVTGLTESAETTFPVIGGPDMTFNGGRDGFAAKVNAPGTGLVFCGYIGGSGIDWGYSIFVERDGHAYVTGYAGSTEATFPVAVGPDVTHNGGSDAFLAKIPPVGPRNDFSGDGQDDILWRYEGPGGYNCVWFLGSGGATADPGIRGGFKGSAAPGSPAAARGMGDGRAPDSSVLDPREVRSLSFREGSGPESFESPRSAAGTAFRKGAPSSFAMPFLRFPATPGCAARERPMEILGGSDLPPVADPNWRIQGTGDFNGDGKPDILWRYSGTGGYNCVWFLDGTEVKGGVDLPSVPDPSWRIQGTGDFNGDGGVDILWRYSGSGGYNFVWFLKGTSIIGGADLPSVSDPNWQIQAIGNFDGDGKPDILWRYYGTGGYNCVWFLDGTEVKGGVDLPSVPDLSWRGQGTGDFNGDGKDDILWRYYGTGGHNCVWFLDGTEVKGGVDLAPVPDLLWKIVSR